VTSPASRADLLAEAFVTLADTLVDDFDVVELLHGLTRNCVGLLGVTAAGIMLDDQRGHLTVVASSSEEMRLLELFQLQNDEGPCLECVRTSRGIVVAELESQAGRWPLFVPAALSVGVRSVVAVPLRLRSVTIGALNLVQDVEGALQPEAHRLAQALADVATIGILQQRSAHRSARLAEQLQHALNSRVVIEQAKGILAERRGVSMEAAFDELRCNARNTNTKLGDYARTVVRGEQEPRGGGGG
jgi:transcriptional regulator with GAF, ATPase, and Fis domain